jgi:hypothetical protein
MSRGEIEASLQARWEELRGELRREWRTMWNERLDDKVNAEGIADKDFPLLFLGRGTVVVATRKFRPPDFFEIMEEQRRLLGASLAPGDVNPCFGGWGKFTKSLNKQRRAERSRRRHEPFKQEKNRALQQKKNGRGWLHRV